MKQFLLFLLIFLLISCTAPMTSTPAVIPASATASPGATVTLSPSPTQPSPTATATVETVAEFNQIPVESMGCLKDDMCLGLRVVDGHAMYMQLLGALSGSYENKKWMGGMKTAEEFLAFLKTSTHKDPVTGEMRAYWVPLTRNGAQITWLQGDGVPANGTFEVNKAVEEAGGFYLDDIGFVAASKAEIEANKGGVADWIKKMQEQNGKNVLVRSGSLGIEQWGLAVVDGQLVFVGMNNGVPLDNYPQKDRLLGQPEAKRNGQIMSAYWELFIRVHFEFANSRSNDTVDNVKTEPDDWDNWRDAVLCVAGTSGTCDGKSPSAFSGEDALFVPAE